MKLGDLITLQRGYDLTDAERLPGTVPVIGSAGPNGYHKEARAKAPGITLGRCGGSFGKVTFIREDFWPHNTTLFVTDFKENDPAFVRYLLETLDFSALNSGSAQQSLNRNYVYGVRIPNFSPPTQRKIAAVLAAYDDLIEANRRRIALLEKMAEEIYREWFVRLRFPGHATTKITKGVPAGWSVRKIGDIVAEVKRGIRQRDLTAEQRYIGLEHIPRRSIALREWATADLVDSDKLRFEERDILFSKIRPYLHKVSLAHFSGVCSTDTIVLRPVEQAYEGYALFTVFSETFIELATVASNGTKMPRADWKFLRKLEMAIPSRELCAQFQLTSMPNSRRLLDRSARTKTSPAPATSSSRA